MTGFSIIRTGNKWQLSQMLPVPHSKSIFLNDISKKRTYCTIGEFNTLEEAELAGRELVAKQTLPLRQSTRTNPSYRNIKRTNKGQIQ